MRSHYALVTAALFFACSPKSADTAGDSGSSVGETDGAEVTSEASPTSGADPSSPVPTGGTPTTPTTTPDESASGPGTTSTSTSSTDTGDETGGAGLPGACAAVCMHFEMCSPGSAGGVEACTAECLDGFAVPSACAMATAIQWDCVAGLACEEALKFIGLGDGPPTSCLKELNNADGECEDIGCNGEVGGGEGFCELEQQCGDKSQNYACEAESNLCTCTENGVPGGQCPEDGFCGKLRDEQIAEINACCGWDWK